MASESLPVHGNQAKRRRVSEGPLEVVEQRPVEVAAHVDPLTEARHDLAKGRVNVVRPLVVVTGRDPIFGDQDSDAWTASAGPPDGSAHGLRVLLVSHLRRLVRLRRIAAEI